MLCMVMAMVDLPKDKRKVEKLYEKYNRLMYVVAFNVLNHCEVEWDNILRAIIPLNMFQK
ncbi:MAG: hypothetical protein SO170_09095 [Butyribacter sp.]|nr:hypothetical protein [Butyribacter sp.]